MNMFTNEIKEVLFEELNKIANEFKLPRNQIEAGAIIEQEHNGTIAKIRKNIHGGKLNMTNREIFKNISKEHVSEKKNYYTLLKKHVEK